jgi:excisionase family DNA binding protein
MEPMLDLLRGIDQKLAVLVEQTQPLTEYLTVRGAATHAGLSPGKIYRAIKANRLRASNVGSPRRATWRIKKSDLDAWMNGHEGGGPAPPEVPVFERQTRRTHFR